MGEKEEEEGAGQSDPREARARGAEEGGGERRRRVGRVRNQAGLLVSQLLSQAV